MFDMAAHLDLLRDPDLSNLIGNTYFLRGYEARRERKE